MTEINQKGLRFLVEDRLYCLQDDIGFVEKVYGSPSSPLSVVNAARCSYGDSSDKFTKKDEKLTKYLWAHGHTSPFRHTYYTFRIKVPLFVMRQWTKYQVASTWREYEVDGNSVSLDIFDVFYDTDKGCSWNELSGRYKELEPQFYIPHQIRGNTGHGSKQSSGELDWDEERHSGYRALLTDKFNEDYRFYKNLLKDGVAKEIARSALPQSIYSEAVWTISLQGILHFLSQRLKPDAQMEIRHCALGIFQLIKDDLDTLGIGLNDLAEQPEW